MKRLLTIFVSVVLLFGVCYAGNKPELKDQKAKDSYSLGYQYGETFKKQGIEIDMDVFTAGIRDALEGKEPGISVHRPTAAAARAGC